MPFLVTARKYRPSSFSDVIAQGHVVDTLINSIRLQRIAHAYLFSGPRGVGKTTTARIFAKALNCPNAVDGESCNTCETCVEIAEGRGLDVIEIDGASNNGVEEVRTIRESVRYMPNRGKYKMYIIDEVHMLSKGAFNALLKTLEEPPAHALFILATTEAHKIPPTVISRCQRYNFKRIGLEDIITQLRSICTQEGINADDRALFTIARKGDGSMRDAESIFDQVVAFSGEELTYDAVKEVLHVVDQERYFAITELIRIGDTREGFALAEQIVMSGYDIQDFLSGLEEHFRNLLVVKSTGETRLVESPEEIRKQYGEVSEHFSEGDLLRLLGLTAAAIQSVRFSSQPRLKFEIALIGMIKMDSTVLISELLEKTGSSGSQPEKVKESTDVTASSQSGVRTSASGYLNAEPSGSARSYRTALTSSAKPEFPSNPVTIATPAVSSENRKDVPHSTKQEIPDHPIVQMLIDRLGAEILPDKR